MKHVEARLFGGSRRARRIRSCDGDAGHVLFLERA